MNVLHINTFDYGGAAVAAIRLHKALLEQKINSNILFLVTQYQNIQASLKYNSTPDPLMKRIINKFSLSTSEKYNKRLEGISKEIEAFSFAYSNHDITQTLAYKNADVINLHWTSYFLDFDFFKKNTKPVVWTMHDMNPFTGGCHYSFECDKHTEMCNNCPQLAGTKSTKSAALNLTYKLNQIKHKPVIKIACPSKWLLNCSKKSKLFNYYKHHHIPYGLSSKVFKIYDKTFSRNVFNLPLNKTILIFNSVNIHNKRKGGNLVFEILKNLPAEVEICIIGKGEKKNIDRRIHYTDYIHDEKLLSILYSAADAFIQPSFEDNLPNVMLEALMCGVPVITFPFGSVSDTIDEKNGIITEEKTLESLLKSIYVFLEKKDLFNNNQIRENAITIFSDKIQAKNYIDLYNSLIK